MGARREFTRGRPRFGRYCRELTENSPKVCQEVHRQFVDRLSRARWEFAGRMLEVHWEFTEENRELAGGSSKRCREFTEENRTTKIVH
ncbi:hypothetical protein GW17_00061907 [Ensete ventricosum]|nr:hypothetical protein GW17_00061907 [Ensete ventricosum]